MLIRIAAYENAIEAHLAHGRLEVEGIPAYVCHENHITANWLRSVALQGVKIYVHPMNGDRAREIIAAHDRGDYALEDNEEVLPCPRCQSTKLSRHRVSWKSALLTTNMFAIPLYFRWATIRCDICWHEWDLPITRAYRLSAISFAAIVAAILCVLFFEVFSPYCLDGQQYFLIFQQSGSCR
jgi:hypothetical protein